MFARGFIQVVGPHNIALQDRLKRSLGRYAAKVHNGLATLHSGIDRSRIGQVRQGNFFARASSAKIGTIGEAQHVAIGFQPVPHGGAKAAGRTRHEQCMVDFDRHKRAKNLLYVV